MALGFFCDRGHRLELALHSALHGGRNFLKRPERAPQLLGGAYLGALLGALRDKKLEVSAHRIRPTRLVGPGLGVLELGAQCLKLLRCGGAHIIEPAEQRIAQGAVFGEFL